MPSSSFRFRLERVRALREQHEQAAKAQYAGALQKQADSQERLDELSEQLNAARELHRSAIAEVQLNAGEVLARQAFVERIQRQHSSGEQDLHSRDQEVQERGVQLQTAASEHRMLERLKERRRAEHQRESLLQEGRMLDEIAVERHGRSAA